MKLYPAINLKNGHCVMLRQGQFHDAEVYSHLPSKVAKNFETLGASFIHVVDLDGALAGRAINADVIREIVDAVSIPVQVGGGIRTIKDIENMMNLGVKKVVIGTAAANNPAFVKDAINTFGEDRIVVSIDTKNGMVAIEGWEKISTYHALSLAVEMKKIGIKTIIYSDIIRDIQLQSPLMDNIKDIVSISELNIIISGGITSMKDLERFSAIKGIYGVIVGKAIYENKINIKRAIDLFEKGVAN
jgi:phosphoribosylformimino-5-aminoimidazole carboxamide ribotide isomerase